MSGKCFCYNDYKGKNCEISLKKCANNCSNQGFCSDGKCLCEKDFIGEDCAIKKLNCSLSGLFNEKTKACDCLEGFYGSNCEYKKCENDCNNQGKCKKDGTCKCFKDFTGYDCSKSKISIIS